MSPGLLHFSQLVVTGLVIGSVYALVALGIALAFRVLAFPDLTVDGSFPLGGAVAARLIVEGWDPYLAAFCGMLAGFVAGCLTGIMNTHFKINSLLAGILMMTMLWSMVCNCILPQASWSACSAPVAVERPPCSERLPGSSPSPRERYA